MAETAPRPIPEESQVRSENGVFLVTPPQEVNVYTATNLRAVLHQAVDDPNCEDIVVEVGELEFMDTTGLGVILGAFKRAQLREKPLIVDSKGSNQKRIARVFEITGIDSVIEVIK